MGLAEIVGKLNRRHKAALCATLISVGVVLLMSHLGIRLVLGVALLGIAFAWALGSNNRLVHWLFFAFGLLLLLDAGLDGYFWPKTKAELIQMHTESVESDRRSIDSDRGLMKGDEESAKQATAARDLEGIREAYKSLGEHSHQFMVDDSEKLRKDEEEVGQVQRKGLLRREVEVDWDVIAGGLLLLSSGLGLLIAIRPAVHSSDKTHKDRAENSLA